MAIEALDAVITADGNITTANLTEVSTLRSTQEVIQILYEIDPKLRLTQEVIQVFYQEHITGLQSLTAGINVIASVSADVTIPSLEASITVEATLSGIITGVRQFNTDITAEATVNAALLNYVRMNAAITADGDMAANIRKNIEYLDAGIAASGDVTIADLDVPWHAGNTLNLTHLATVEKVLARSLEHTLDLQHQVDLVFGQRALSASSQILFTHNATVIRVLPTQAASNTITFTQSLSEYREAISYLVLTHSAVGTIDFIEGITSSVLNLTDSVSPAGSVFNLSAASQLNLTHLADGDAEKGLSVSSNLNLKQNAFGVVLAGKKYILLQAPFELIQTSVILPNPLLDDNESLVSNLVLRRSMNNTPRTYVQTSDSRRLRYTFTLNRLKALELEAFFDSYSGADIKMLNWKGEIWRVKLITNPIDYVQTRRAEPGGDRTDVNVEFEGVLLNG